MPACGVGGEVHELVPPAGGDPGDPDGCHSLRDKGITFPIGITPL